MRNKIAAVLTVIVAAVTAPAVCNIFALDEEKPAAVSQPAHVDAARPAYSGWGRDPFAKMQGGAAVRLTGILRNKDRLEAIINDRKVPEGARVDQYTVVRISKESVILNDGKQDIEVKLSK